MQSADLFKHLEAIYNHNEFMKCKPCVDFNKWLIDRLYNCYVEFKPEEVKDMDHDLIMDIVKNSNVLTVEKVKRLLSYDEIIPELKSDIVKVVCEDNEHIEITTDDYDDLSLARDIRDRFVFSPLVEVEEEEEDENDYSLIVEEEEDDSDYQDWTFIPDGNGGFNVVRTG